MEVNYFDIIASAIILLLGLKGILNGFFKEVFGLLGIIGGIFIASRFGPEVGEYLNNLIFNFDNKGAIGFTGFLVTLGIFWLLMISTGLAFKKLSKISGLGVYDRILGFTFGASKFFLIAAVIAHAVYNVNSLRPTIDSAMQNSFLFPILTKTGSVIMKIDPVSVSDDINKTIDNATKTIEKQTQTIIDEKAKEIAKDVDNQIKEQFETNQKEIFNE
ncbi:CvpA family protein [Sulfurimonas lithotrophica]|uniref:CvpA family protein n=1 Tax=Sulfurimonas lithotrophica TaxID=2590022 RepID=A0A5P8P186_9BACT|nr:CvpA family protein [Sulfurimonas lithotrophica]QFR49488.1 CvpA family protein [Sulfurimonas lithotrophica]